VAERGIILEKSAVAPSSTIVICRDHRLFLTGSKLS
jgi:hypothetical protein